MPEVVARIRAAIAPWPASAPSLLSPPGSRPSFPLGEIVWVCGPTAVGKSSVGWAVYMRSLRAGTRTAFADLDTDGRTPADLAGEILARLAGDP